MMSALPSFAQIQTPANGLTGSSLGTIGGEQADLLGFGALLSQNAPSDAAAATHGDPSGGHFQDVQVILQLLRSSQSEPDAPLPLNDQAAVTTAPVNGGPSAPLAALLLDPSQMGQASTQDLLDMAAQWAEQPAGGQHATTPTAPSDPLMPAQSSPDLVASNPPLAPTDAPAPSHAMNREADQPDLASTQARQQAEALDILLSLTQAGPAAAPALPAAAALPVSLLAAGAGSKMTLAAGATTVDTGTTNVEPSDNSASPLDALMGAATGMSRKPVAQGSAQLAAGSAAISANHHAATDAAMAGPSGLARGMTSPAPFTPTLAPVTTASPTSAAPVGDLGAAMSVMFTTPAASTGPAQAATAADGAQGVSEHWLDMHSDDAWIDQLAKDIAATKSATGDISFRLMPRHLGRLDVSMMQSDQGVSVRLDTQHETTAAIVTAAQTRLVDELRQQGVRVAGADVTHTPQDMTRQNSQGQGRSSQNELHHLIETASERLPETDSDDKGTADRHGRFA